MPHGRPRGAASHACREKAGSQGGGTNAPCTCSQGRRHLIATSYARPAGRSRPPSASVQRRNYSPRALQRTEFIIYRFCPRSPAYSAESASGAGLFLLMLNDIYAGGPVLIKKPPRRPLLRPPQWSFLLLFCSHRQGTETAKTVRKGQGGRGLPRDGRRTRPGPALSNCPPAHVDPPTC